MSVTTRKNGGFNVAEVTGVSITTGDYKEKEGLTRDVKRKTSYIVPTLPEDYKALEDFGLTKYTPKETVNEDGVKLQEPDFFIAPFSGSTLIYDESDNTKRRVELDASKPNFKIANASLAITRTMSAQKQMFNRVSAIKVASQAEIEVFAMAFFDESDGVEYTSVIAGELQAPAE